MKKKRNLNLSIQWKINRANGIKMCKNTGAICKTKAFGREY